MEYYSVLSQLHRIRKPKIYLEVGVRSGESLQLAYGNTKCIAIDPDHKINKPFLYTTSFHKITSDQYFERELYLKEYGNEKIELAFIDGMHLFEFVLRDFINIEKFSSNRGMIVLHDCLPENEVVAERERKTSFWTGDVWKMVPILQEYRKDLKITILDSEPTGLVLIEGLNSESAILSSNYDKIVDKYMNYEFKNTKLIRPQNTKKYIHWISFLNNYKRKSKKLIAPLRRIFSKPKCLGILMCYNDADILQDAINHLIKNKHDIIIWNHGSTDSTDEVIKRNISNIIEYKIVPREFDFYEMYPSMSRYIMEYYKNDYDWISWPDQDEFLEGPSRSLSYYNFITLVYQSKYNWIQFNNYNYWFTLDDDNAILSPVERIKSYSLFPDCAPRIRSWRSSAMNIREFNHNPPIGSKYPIYFNLRHYPMRSSDQMLARIEKDRSSIQRENQNVHYNYMRLRRDLLLINRNQLHHDDGEDLNSDIIYDWGKIYKP